MKVLSIIMIALLLLSCKPKEKEVLAEKESDTIVVYNEVSYAAQGGYKPENKKIFKIIDSPCIKGTNRAEKEIREGRYTYFYGAGLGFSDAKMEFYKQAFLKKGIRIDFYFVSCVGGGEVPDGKFKFKCYEKTMNAAFEKKYGKSLIDSMNKACVGLREEAFRMTNNID